MTCCASFAVSPPASLSAPLEAWWPALLAVLLISAISLVGAASLLVSEERVRRALPYLVSVAVGALLGSTFLHLLPDLAEGGFTPGLGAQVLAGMLLFFLLERFLHSHAHGHDQHGAVAPFAWLNLAGDGLHNFADGMMVAAAWMQGSGAGLAATIAVALHEIPQELSDIGILLHGGFSRGKAVLFNLLTALLAVLGAVLMLAVGHRVEGLSDVVLALAAGGFIYIAAADLIPELHRERRALATVVQVLLLMGGAAAMGLFDGH
jgi:zinc and cadmium transporter